MIARGEALARTIARVAPDDRDAFVDRILETPPLPRPAARVIRDDDDLIDCIASGTAAVAHALLAARVGPDDVFVDVGAGLGTACVLAHLLTGARAIGLEIQPELVGAANARAVRLGLEGVSFVLGDARSASLPPGTVYYLYTPFTGDSMNTVQARLCTLAETRSIAVCCLGFDLCRAGALRVIDDDSVFLTVYESAPRDAPVRATAPPELPSLRAVARGERGGDGS